VNISVGVASYPEDRVSNGMELLSFADKIMDKAKEEGGNIVVSSMDLVKGLGTGIAIRDEKGDVKLLRNQINKLNKRSKQSIVESIFAFAKTIELRDHYTGEHVENTVKYARLIAEALDVRKKMLS
jgi:response regulator RpfG family c-di-GMP phosphodiesterase